MRIDDNQTRASLVVPLSVAGLDGCGNTGRELATQYMAQLLPSVGHPHLSRHQRHWRICLWLRLPALSEQPRDEVSIDLRWASMRMPEVWRQPG